MTAFLARVAVAAGLVLGMGTSFSARASEVRAASPTQSLQLSWRGYVGSFASPSQLPFAQPLGLELASAPRVESFVRVMARTGMDPATLAEESPERQASAVREAVAEYGRKMAATASRPDAPPDQLHEADLELRDLSTVAQLVSDAERLALAREHGAIMAAIARREEDRTDPLLDRIKQVRDAWSRTGGPHGTSFIEAPAEGLRRGSHPDWSLAKAPAKNSPSPSQSFADVPSSHWNEVVLLPETSWLSASAPVQFLRGIAGFARALVAEAFGALIPSPMTAGNRLPILREGDLSLLRPAAAVASEAIVSPEFQGFLDDLVHTMQKEGGLGLAAPQVGRAERVAAIRLKDGARVLINPRVTVLGSGIAPHLEGCLSSPEEMAFVTRPQKIRVDYVDRGGAARSEIFRGLAAAIVQHEVDHLDGILFTMRTKRGVQGLADAKAKILPQPLRLELAWFAAQLKRLPKRQDLRRKLMRGVFEASEPGTFASALREGLAAPDEEAVLREVLAYYRIRLDTTAAPEKAQRLRAWLKSPAHVAFVRADLTADPLPGDDKILSELAFLVPLFDAFNGPYLKDAMAGDSAKIAIPGVAGRTPETMAFPTWSQAVEFAWLARRYSLVATPDGARLAFPAPDGLVDVDVSSLDHARALVLDFEDSAAVDVRDLSLKPSPLRRVRFDDDKPISFGLEAEMNLRDNPDIVMDYRLASFPEEDWKQLSRQSRLVHGQKTLDGAAQAMGKDFVLFTKLSDSPPELPDNLTNEGNGNFELNGPVFSSYDNLEKFVRGLFRRYGPSSLQAHVAYKNHDQVEGVAGYVVFEADAAQLKTLERGHARRASDPSFIPGKNLSHHSLAPMGEDDRQLYARFEAQALLGRRVGNPGDSRIINAPVFRDDVYPDGYRGHEFRQFHKRADDLLDAVDGFSAHMQNSGDLRAFKPFAEVPQISADLPAARAEELGLRIDRGSWSRYFEAAGEAINGLYPRLSKGGANVSQRFFYPFKDWLRHPVVEGLPEPERTRVQTRVRAATRSLIVSFDTLAKEGGAVDRAELAKLQVLVAAWAHEASLSEHFEAFRRRALAAGPRAPPLEKFPFVRSIRLRDPSDSKLPEDALPFRPETFPNGPRYLRSSFPAGAAGSPAYLRFLDATVEVIYGNVVPYGHISIRVGRRIYSLNSVQNTLRANFDPARVGHGKTGFVYHVGEKKIAGVQEELERFFKNSAESNVPAFDAHSPLLEVVSRSDGSLRYRIPFFLFANDNPAAATLTESAEGPSLTTADGFRYPVERRDGKLYTQSLSCATAATHILRKYFRIEIAFDHGAKTLRDALLRGNPGGDAPAAIIDY